MLEGMHMSMIVIGFLIFVRLRLKAVKLNA